jgi:hypothetical protein
MLPAESCPGGRGSRAGEKLRRRHGRGKGIGGGRSVRDGILGDGFAGVPPLPVQEAIGNVFGPAGKTDCLGQKIFGFSDQIRTLPCLGRDRILRSGGDALPTGWGTSATRHPSTGKGPPRSALDRGVPAASKPYRFGSLPSAPLRPAGPRCAAAAGFAGIRPPRPPSGAFAFRAGAASVNPPRFSPAPPPIFPGPVTGFQGHLQLPMITKGAQ